MFASTRQWNRLCAVNEVSSAINESKSIAIAVLTVSRIHATAVVHRRVIVPVARKRIDATRYRIELLHI